MIYLILLCFKEFKLNIFCKVCSDMFKDMFGNKSLREENGKRYLIKFEFSEFK